MNKLAFVLVEHEMPSNTAHDRPEKVRRGSGRYKTKWFKSVFRLGI